MTPVLLDLFCKAGGAGEGYSRAGFDVIGVDIVAQPRYPFLFVQADALEFLRRNAQHVDAVHASPPCQRYTHGNAAHRDNRHPDLVAATRDALDATGLPYVIENVPRAPLRSPVVLCGTQFGLTATDTDGTLLHLRRHRLFESNVLLTPPGPCQHRRGVQWAGAYGGARRDKVEARTVRKGGYVPPDLGVLRALLGTPWMTEGETFEAVPPAYTEHLGRQLLSHVKGGA